MGGGEKEKRVEREREREECVCVCVRERERGKATKITAAGSVEIKTMSYSCIYNKNEQSFTWRYVKITLLSR